MTYLFSQYWIFIALAVVLGLFVGWATREGGPSSIGGWVGWAIAWFLAGLFVALFKWLPGLAGHLLEVALMLFAAFVIGCIAGCGARGASHGGGAAATTHGHSDGHGDGHGASAPAAATPSGAANAAHTHDDVLGVDSSASYPGARPAVAVAGSKADDLTRIAGVDAATAKTLGDIGVTQYSQIGGWGAPQTAWVEHHLAQPGRIGRENWIEQARNLGSGKTPAIAAAAVAAASGIAAASGAVSSPSAPVAPAKTETSSTGTGGGETAGSTATSGAAATKAETASGGSASGVSAEARPATAQTSAHAPDTSAHGGAPAQASASGGATGAVQASAAAAGAVAATAAVESASPTHAAASATVSGASSAAAQPSAGADAATSAPTSADAGAAAVAPPLGMTDGQRSILAARAKMAMQGGRAAALAAAAGGVAHAAAAAAPVAASAIARALDVAPRANMTDGQRSILAAKQRMAEKAARVAEAAVGETGAEGTGASAASATAATTAAADAQAVEAGRPAADSAPHAPADDLKLIKGIGPKNEAALNGLGVRRFAQIADWTPENAHWVGHSIKFPGRIEREHWIPQARLLAAGGDTAHSAAVKSGAIKIDASADAPMSDAEAAALASSLPTAVATAGAAAAADAHGAASSAQGAGDGRPAADSAPHAPADDLKLIKGVGPKNEAALNGLGVRRFAQIADWTPENAHWVGHSIKFPGRIEREHWIEQAKFLAAGVDTPHSAAVKSGAIKIDDSADAPMSDAEAAAFAATLPQQAAKVDNERSYAGSRPLGLAGPRGGKADDLKLIKGIGRQNEERLHALGVWHFDQIAAWSVENVKWIGSYLAFPGRIDREGWIAQAHSLALGEKTEFAKRVEAGDVPSSKNLI